MVTAVSNGTRSLFASEREVPYYKLGHRTNRRITDHQEMMKEAGIDKVHYETVEAVLPDGVSRFIVPTNHVLWTNPFTGEQEIIGTVGSKYNVLQPNDVFGVFKGLKHPWTTMGIINDGREMFGIIEWEKTITLDPNGANEEIKTWLTVRSSNDGTGSLVGGRTSMRFICFNMFRTMFRGLEDKFSIRHTMSAQDKIAKVNLELAKTDVFYDAQEKAVTEMFQTSLTDEAFWKIVKEDFFPKPEEDKRGAFTKWDNKMGLIAEAWNHQNNAAIHGTVYGAWQALLEYNQWGRNVQHGRSAVSSVTGLPAGEENFWQAGAGFDNSTETFRADSFRRFYDLVPNRSLTV